MAGLPLIVFFAAQTPVTPPVAPPMAPPAPVMVPHAAPPAPPVIFAPPPPVPLAMTDATDPREPWPLANPNAWVTVADYPGDALRGGARGMTRYALSVGADGRVTGCTIAVSSQVRSLDEATCRLVTARARFAPATDAGGQAIAGSFRGYAMWVPPSEVPQPGQMVVDYYVETDGNHSFCEVKSATGAFAGKVKVGLMPCPSQGFAHPYTDTKGQPVRRHVTMTNTVSVDEAPN